MRLVKEFRKEFRIVWQQTPLTVHETRVAFARAKTPEDAVMLVRDKIERSLGITEFQIINVSESPELPPGEVFLA